MKKFNRHSSHTHSLTHLHQHSYNDVALLKQWLHSYAAIQSSIESRNVGAQPSKTDVPCSVLKVDFSSKRSPKWHQHIIIQAFAYRFKNRLKIQSRVDRTDMKGVTCLPQCDDNQGWRVIIIIIMTTILLLLLLLIIMIMVFVRRQILLKEQF